MLRLLRSLLSFVKRPQLIGLLAGIVVSIALLGGIAMAGSTAPPQSESRSNSALPNAGLFLPPSQIAGNMSGTALRIGDFNHDGRNDVAISSNTLNVFLQEPTGAMNSFATYPSTAAARSLAVGDVNHDGLADLVQPYKYQDSIGVYLQTVSGTMNSETLYTVGDAPDAVAVGDVNNDGLDDVVVSHLSTTAVGVLVQKADGTLDEMVPYAGHSSSAEEIALGDVNGDGRTDVIKSFENGNDGFEIYYQNQSGTLDAAVVLGSPSRTSQGIAVGDVTGDGRDDVVITSGLIYGTVMLYAQNASGGLNAPIEYKTNSMPTIVEMEDVNSDGRRDVIFGAWNSLGGAFLQNSSGLLTKQPDSYFIPQGSKDPQSIDVGDINSDGYPDIVALSNGLYALYHTDPSDTPTPKPTAVLVVKTIMTEGFEGVFPRKPWTVTSNGWGKSNCEKAGGSYSAWAIKKTGAGCGADYPVNQKNWMEYGPFSLENAKKGDLYFNVWLNAEQGKDSLFVGASIDGKKFYGQSYTGTTGSVAEYKNAEWNADNNTYLVELAVEGNLSPNTQNVSWGYGHFDLTKVYKLGNLAGKPRLWIAFVWRSDAQNTLPNGAFVDDVLLTKTIKR